MKRIGLAVGVVLLAFLATVAVGNHSVVRADNPASWKAVPYGPVNVSPGVLTKPLANLLFDAPEAGFVWVNSTGFCTFVSPLNTISGITIGWRNTIPFPLSTSSGDAFFNNILTTVFVGESLPYSASAVFPILAGTNTLFLQYINEGVVANFGAQCSGVNVVMFTNTQLP